jgi:flavin reductase ActVB
VIEGSVTATASAPAALPLDERQERFRAAMARYPSGVIVVTTTDPQGTPWGFTATSFCSVSMSPPLVLFCLDKRARCHPAFLAAKSWAINVLGCGQSKLAMRFASRTADKFGGGEFRPGFAGNPVLDQACFILDCEQYDVLDGGDHTIVLGEVLDARALGETPAVYVGRRFARLHDPVPHP